MLHSVLRAYKYFPNEKITGVFGLVGQPGYSIRDQELIKQIAIKDFDHFMNHQSFINVDQ